MEEILDQLRLVVYPIIYDVLYIPGGAGCLPSTVGSDLLRPCLVKHSGSRGRIPHGQFPTWNIPWRSVVNGRNRQMRRDINQQSGPWHNFKTCFFGKQSPYERTCYLGVSLESQTASPNYQSVTKLKQDMWKKNITPHASCYFALTTIYLILLVVSTHLKNISQIGSFPQVGMKIKNISNHHLVIYIYLQKHFSPKSQNILELRTTPKQPPPRAAPHGVNTCVLSSSASAIMAWPQREFSSECRRLPGYQI